MKKQFMRANGDGNYRTPTHLWESAHRLDLHELQEQVELLVWLQAEDYYRKNRRRWRLGRKH